jgi:hypothetical protein
MAAEALIPGCGNRRVLMAKYLICINFNGMFIFEASLYVGLGHLRMEKKKPSPYGSNLSLNDMTQ